MLQPDFVNALAKIGRGEYAGSFQSIADFQDTYWGLTHHVMITDMKGNVKVSPAYKNPLNNHLNSKIEQVIEGKKVTGFFSFTEKDHNHSLLILPLKRSGIQIGYLVIELEIEKFLKLLQTNNDRIRSYLVTPEAELVTRKKSDSKSLTAHKGIAEAIKQKKYMGIVELSNAEDVIGFYEYSDQFPWIIATEITESDLFHRLDTDQYLVIVIAITIFFLSALTGIILSNKLTKPLQSATEITKRVASGNLSQPDSQITGNDEFGQISTSLLSMASALRKDMQELSNRSSQISSSSTELAATAQDLAYTTASGKTASNERGIRELMQSLEKNAKLADEAQKTSVEATEKADTGGKNVTDAVDI
ncbi:MAG: methyl-accepting chemotaxis protein, partial [Leptospiraceae bacterium]|nr:methyl-accepting chemotaxis protein [Leptospiraceae bacterium]